MRKRMGKLLSVLLTLAMVVGLMPATALAADTVVPDNEKGVTYTPTLSKEKFDVSDEDQTVTLTIDANKEITWDGIGFKAYYDSPLKLTNITNKEVTLTAGDIQVALGSGDNGAGYQTADGENSTITNICVLHFTIPANTPAGTYNLGIQKLEITSDYGEIWEGKATVMTQLTIKAAEVVVTGVSLNKSETTLTEGATETLTATVTPDNATDKTVTWTSSDNSVATVANGVVTAVKAGTATITAKAGDKTATCVVTVKAAHVCTGTLESGQAATCTVDGWKDYYKCTCEKLYEDANCEAPITDLEAWKVGAGKIAAGHDYGTLIEAKAEVHTQAELKASVAAHYFCDECDTYFTEEKVETTLEELTGETPVHSYGAWVNTDPDKHWKECSCGLKAEEGTHDFTDGDCVCGKEAPEAPKHEHDWAETYNSNETHHWFECKAADCDVTENSQKAGYGEHDFTDGNCVCGKEAPEAPKHEHNWATEDWEKDETHHWHECYANTECDITDNSKKDGYGEHEYVDGVCVCGAEEKDVPVEEKYTVTVENGSGDGEYAAGAEVTIKADSKSGYKFDKWIVESDVEVEIDVNDSETTFTMPAGNVKVTADYDKISSGSSSSGGSTKYKVTLEDTDNGTVESSRTKASKGTTVTITVDPEADYEVDDIVVETKAGKEVEVTDKGEGKFTFKMPAANVTVSVDFAKADVEDSDAKDEVEYIQLTIDSVIAWVFDEYVANDVAPVIRNARTMLPARFVAEALGGVVTWDETEQKVTIVNGEDTIEIFIGEPFATVNGDPVELDSPAFIENSRTYLPIRFIAENMGATVTWDAADRTVTIVPGE